jgi:hypothetical protein
MIMLSSRALLAWRNKAPLGRISGSNDAKSHFELGIKSLLSTRGALGTAILIGNRPCLHGGGRGAIGRIY